MSAHRGRRLANAAVCLTACLLLCGTVCADAPRYDTDGDGALTVYDYIRKKREALEHPGGTAADEAAAIADFLSGTGTLTLGEETTGELPGAVHAGSCTWYNGGITSGRCGLAPIPEDIFVTAINNEDYAEGLLAGAYLRVTAANGKSVDVLVTDTSAQGSGDLDLNVNAFEQLAEKGWGRLEIEWQIIPYPAEGGVQYRFSPDSSQFYTAFQVLGHTYPIASVELLQSDGTWAPVKHRSDHYFIMSAPGKGPFTLRLTDIYGQSFIEADVPLSPGETVQGSSNFPAIAENT